MRVFVCAFRLAVVSLAASLFAAAPALAISLQADLTNLGGVAPILIYRPTTQSVESISGLGWWPKAADPDYFRQAHDGRIPRGIHRSVMPAAVDAFAQQLGDGHEPVTQPRELKDFLRHMPRAELVELVAKRLDRQAFTFRQ